MTAPGATPTPNEPPRPFRAPPRTALRAVCWYHNDCPGPSVCACPCHAPSLFDRQEDTP